VAQQTAPDATVVYVDIDPVAVSHGQAILANNPRAHAVHGDLRRPHEILGHPDVAGLLDLSQPVAVLLIAVLHFIPDDADPAGLVRQIDDGLVAGSYLAISHGTPAPHHANAQEAVRNLYTRTPTPFYLRTPEQVAALLRGLEVVDPGIVPISDWHPDPEEADEPAQPAGLAAVARKP
jgi:hypothetical protein